MAVIAFGLIASAVCALLGSLFVPFFIVPKLDWLFWGWFEAFIQYSFISSPFKPSDVRRNVDPLSGYWSAMPRSVPD